MFEPPYPPSPGFRLRLASARLVGATSRRGKRRLLRVLSARPGLPVTGRIPHVVPYKPSPIFNLTPEDQSWTVTFTRPRSRGANRSKAALLRSIIRPCWTCLRLGPRSVIVTSTVLVEPTRATRTLVPRG